MSSIPVCSVLGVHVSVGGANADAAGPSPAEASAWSRPLAAGPFSAVTSTGRPILVDGCVPIHCHMTRRLITLWLAVTAVCLVAQFAPHAFAR